jgi:hypothetical protein
LQASSSGSGSRSVSIAMQAFKKSASPVASSWGSVS